MTQDRTHDDQDPHVDDDLREAIETALSERAPTEDDRAEWAREAMERAGDLPVAPRPPVLRIALVLAAAAAILLLAILLGGRGEPAATEDGGSRDDLEIRAASSAEIEEARAANEKALRSDEVREWLAKVPAGRWAGIARGGKVLIASVDLATVLEYLDPLTPEAPHRFVFRVGEQGDVTYPTTFDYEVVVGTKVLADFDLSFSSGPGGWAFRSKDGKATQRAPSPDGRPFLGVAVLRPDRGLLWEGHFLVATGYGGPLILPDGKTLARFEIPGTATVGTTRKYRRFVADVHVQGLGNRHLEVLGDRLTPAPTLKLNGVEWRRHSPETLSEARRGGKDLLVLVCDVSGLLPMNAFDGLKEPLSRFVTAAHVTRWTDPHGLSGKPFEAPAELVAYRVGKTDAKLLGRFRLAANTTAQEVGGFLRKLPRPEPRPYSPEAEIRERAANDAALRSPEVRRRLDEAGRGTWAIIADGRLVAVDRDLGKALKTFREVRAVDALHAYVFRVGTEGDVTYETTWPYEQVVGNRFLAEADLSFSMGPGGSAFWPRAKPPGDLAKLRRFPSPDGRPYLPLQIALNRDNLFPATFLVATGYSGPLILPDWYRLGGLETPGLATVKDMHGNERVYRRYSQRVVSKEIGIDLYVEALGDRQTPAPVMRLGGVDWSRHHPDLLERCLKEGKLLLLVVADVSQPFPIAPFGEGASRPILDGFVRAIHWTPWTSPYGIRRSPAGLRAPELLVYAPVPGESDFVPVARWRIEDRKPEDVRSLLKPFVNGGAYRKQLEQIRREREIAGTEVRLTFRVDVAWSAVPYPPFAAVVAALSKRLEGTGARFEGRAVWDLPDAKLRELTVVLPPSCEMDAETVRAICERKGASLEFRIVAEPDDPTVDGPLRKHLGGDRKSLPASPDPDYPGYRSFPDAEGEGTTVVRIDRWNFTHRDLTDLSVVPAEGGIGWIVRFGIRDEREGDFGRLTGPNSATVMGEGRRMAIVLDGEVVSAPYLENELRDGGIISGGGVSGYTKAEAGALAASLRTGPLPAPLKLIRIERVKDGRVVETKEVR